MIDSTLPATPVPRCRLCGTDHDPGTPACPLTRVGQTIAGKYRLDKMLGCGGMGAVYVAENLALGKTVAVKMLHAKLASTTEIVERFRREARAVAQLKHPGFAQVFALETLPGGELAIEMELLDGIGLDALIRKEVPAIERAVALLASALEALAVAHAAGLVHRDLKPENLFVCREAGRGEYVKVLDFGIARGRESEGLTQSGVMMGTVAYASPEQLRDVAKADARSDVYSFGATIYETLVGRPPISGASLAEAMSRILTGEIDRHPAKARADVPAWLDALVARCLATDPAERFADAATLRAALVATAIEPGLQTALTSPGPTATPAPTAPPAPPPKRGSKPMLIGGIGVAAAAIAGGIVFATHGGGSKDVPAPPAVAPTPKPAPVVKPPPPETPPGMVRIEGAIPFALDAFEVSTADYAGWLANRTPKPTIVDGNAVLDGKPLVTVSGGDLPAVQRRALPLVLDEHASGVAIHSARRGPMTMVTWFGAKLYCEDRGARLPTSAEWELARGTGTEPPACDRVVFGRAADASWGVPKGPCAGLTEHPVELLATAQDRTPAGVVGMIGNVREWVADPTKGSHVTRGCSFLDPPERCTAEAGEGAGDNPDIRIGFRCAKDLPR